MGVFQIPQIRNACTPEWPSFSTQTLRKRRKTSLFSNAWTCSRSFCEAFDKLKTLQIANNPCLENLHEQVAKAKPRPSQSNWWIDDQIIYDYVRVKRTVSELLGCWSDQSSGEYTDLIVSKAWLIFSDSEHSPSERSWRHPPTAVTRTVTFFFFPFFFSCSSLFTHR